MKGMINRVPRRVRRAIAFGTIIGLLALPMIGCGDSSDFGEIGARVDAQSTQTAQLPHIHNGVASAPPTPNCRNADGSYNC
jgi:hypothetical protein